MDTFLRCVRLRRLPGGFTKVFKKSEGITPSQYRRDFLEKEQ